MENSRKPRGTEPPDLLGEAVAGCLARHVTPGRHLVVGLSGGVDSVSLLHAVARQAPGRFSLSALHVHHGLSHDADRWAAFCAETCARLGVPFECAHVRVDRGAKDGLEAAARRARHGAFAAVDADWLVLAHHRDDQAETLLFRLLRGTGPTGLAAMRECSGRLLRPLLTIGRAEIEDYAHRHRLEWIEDESNADIRHSRNFLRQKIFPELSRRFPAAAKNMAAAAARCAEANDLLDALARIDLGASADFPVSLEALARLDEARARNALRHLLARHGVMIPGEARLREALRQLLDAAPDRHPAPVLGQHCLRRRGGKVYLESVEP